jgi:hypothetical protein
MIQRKSDPSTKSHPSNTLHKRAFTYELINNRTRGMSSPSQIDPSAVGEATSEAKSVASQQSSLNARVIGLLLVAGLLTGAVAAFVAIQGSGTGPYRLQTIGRTELEQARTSLQPDTAGQAVEDARQCKSPLAVLTVQAEHGSGAQQIRIRSGNYVSPSLVLGDAPQRVAIPFPAPYATGKGEFIVEGSTHPVTIWLVPAHTVGSQPGSDRISVIWATNDPCPR